MIKLQRLNVIKVVESEVKAKALESKGFKRVEEPNEEKSLDSMTVSELEAFAAKRGIDLSDCQNKAEKLAKIKLSVEGGA
jgi:hypothetical protein